MEDPIINYEHLHRYRFAREFAKDKKVLDLACGEGYGSFMLSEVSKGIIGIDIDKNVIGHATSKYNKENLRFIVGSIKEIPIEGKDIFDLIICFEALEHITEQDKLITEVKRLLRPDGIFLVSSPNKYIYSDQSGYQNPFHKRELYFNEFTKLLDKYFKHTYIYGQTVNPSSNIFNLLSDLSTTKNYIIEKCDKEFLFVGNEKKEARYFIAFASDSTIKNMIGYSYLLDISDSVTVQKDAQIENLEATIREKDAQIGILEATIREKDAQIGSLEATIREKDAQIGSLEATIREKNAQIRSLEAAIREINLHIKNLEVEICGKESHIKNIENLLNEKEKILDTIYKSRGWRALNIYYRVKANIFQ